LEIALVGLAAARLRPALRPREFQHRHCVPHYPLFRPLVIV
jgi:hypothetical protein